MAKAEDVAPIDFLLEYSAEQGCPDGSTFEAALRARLPAARRVAASETSEATPLIRIRLPAAGTAQTREISAELPDGTRFLREVPDAACVDALQSMAVIAAMALEGNQRAMSSTSPAAATKASVQKTAPAEASPPAARGPRPVAAMSHDEASLAATAPRASWQWSALGSAGLEAGMAPSVAPAIALGLELRDPSVRDFSPSIRLSGLYAQSLAERFGAADVRFRLLAGRLDFCPTRAHSRGWGVAACAEVEAGELRGSADHVAQRRDQTMPWLGLGVVGRAELALSRSFALELGVSGRALAVHDRFGLRPSRVVRQVPVVSCDLLVGLRFRWR